MKKSLLLCWYPWFFRRHAIPAGKRMPKKRRLPMTVSIPLFNIKSIVCRHRNIALSGAGIQCPIVAAERADLLSFASCSGRTRHSLRPHNKYNLAIRRVLEGCMKLYGRQIDRRLEKSGDLSQTDMDGQRHSSSLSEDKSCRNSRRNILYR